MGAVALVPPFGIGCCLTGGGTPLQSDDSNHQNEKHGQFDPFVAHGWLTLAGTRLVQEFAGEGQAEILLELQVVGGDLGAIGTTL